MESALALEPDRKEPPLKVASRPKAPVRRPAWWSSREHGLPIDYVARPATAPSQPPMMLLTDKAGDALERQVPGAVQRSERHRLAKAIRKDELSVKPERIEEIERDLVDMTAKYTPFHERPESILIRAFQTFDRGHRGTIAADAFQSTLQCFKVATRRRLWFTRACTPSQLWRTHALHGSLDVRSTGHPLPAIGHSLDPRVPRSFQQVRSRLAATASLHCLRSGAALQEEQVPTVCPHTGHTTPQRPRMDRGMLLAWAGAHTAPRRGPQAAGVAGSSCTSRCTVRARGKRAAEAGGAFASPVHRRALARDGAGRDGSTAGGVEVEMAPPWLVRLIASSMQRSNTPISSVVSRACTHPLGGTRPGWRATPMQLTVVCSRLHPELALLFRRRAAPVILTAPPAHTATAPPFKLDPYLHPRPQA